MSAPLLVVMGVSGSGKSTVGSLLAAELALPFLDGDDLHPATNVAKMAQGTPLTDADRLPWLAAVGRRLADSEESGLVVACSALRRVYRDAIVAVAPTARFAHLAGTGDLLATRMSARADHFMPTSLLTSQLETLEPLQPDERGLTVAIDAAPSVIVARIIGELAGV